MADYEFKYNMKTQPEPRNDGSGMVAHDIDAVARVQGSGEAFVTVPGRHKTVLVPAADLLTIMAMSNGGAKVNAYKNALASNLNTEAVPVTGWSAAELEVLLDANDQSIDAAAQANEYITVDLGQSYPVQFSF